MRSHSSPACVSQARSVASGFVAPESSRRAGRPFGQPVKVFNDNEARTCRERARDLCQSGHGPFRLRQHAIDRGDIEQRRTERQVVHVAMLQLAMAEPGAVHV